MDDTPTPPDQLQPPPFRLGTVPEAAAPAGKPAAPRRGVSDDLL